MAELKQPNNSNKDRVFARVVATHRHAVTRYAMRRLDNRDAVEDLVAETFVVVWRHLDQLPKASEQLFWLYGISGRVLANINRGRTRSFRLESRLAFEREREAEIPRFTAEDVEELMRGLAQLSPHELELIQLFYWDELSYKQIGLVFRCSPKAAGVRLTRAKQHLRDLLNSESTGRIAIAVLDREDAP